MQRSFLTLSLISFVTACAGLGTASAQSSRVVITAQPGYTITWDGNNGGFSSPEPGTGPADNVALASNGSTAFGSTEVGLNTHFIPNVNDGFYGNSSSWIPDFVNGDADPFIGISFGKSVDIKSIAWGRDNGDTTEPGCGGTCMDRAVGVYTLQVTKIAAPDNQTPETGDAATGWVTIGTVEYKAGTDDKNFSAYLRHHFEVAFDGQPISATALRIKVSSNQLDIDEIEVNPQPDPIPPLSNFIVITSGTGYTIDWNGNDGKFFDAAAGAHAPNNRALSSNGTVAFGSSEFGQGVHFIKNVNDGLYGNSHSWIPNFTAPDPNPYIGLNFGGSIDLKSVAWSRDNGDSTESACGGQCTDRDLGIYTLQITQIANPGTDTPESDDPTKGWVTVGTVNYKAAGPRFTPHLRHRFNISATGGATLKATGVRIKVPDTNTDIDEIEINVNPAVEDNLLIATGAAGYAISWDGNDGDFYNPNAGASAPGNDALASNGTTAFGSSELNFGIHFINHVNDGLYGNTFSWIADFSANPDPDPFIGLNFGKTVDINNIAWSRDNGNNPGDCCGGQLQDRWQGVYTLQITTAPSPGVDTQETGDAATGWVTIGTVEYAGAAPPDFNPWFRHRFDVAANAKPISATGLRIKVPNNNICIDEIEVNPSAVPPPPISINPSAGYTIAWDGNDGSFSDPAAPAKSPSNVALASGGATAFGSSEFGQGVHFIANVNDGLYGNKHSWISDFTKPDANPFAGIRFGKTVSIKRIAWSRDNGDNTEGPSNPNTDRALGIYTIQVTSAANPDASTAETSDPATGWVTVGTVEYRSETQFFKSYLRHAFNIATGGQPISATAVRIKVSSNQLAIDEIEVNPQENIFIKGAGGYIISWDGNDGEFFDPADGAAAPDNAARDTSGVVAFGSSEYGADIHLIAHVNDGLYGNSFSWIPNFAANPPDPDPFIGLNFGKAISIQNIAWSRDNGNDPGDCCGGQLRDRSLGLYTLQVTAVANPDIDTPDTGDTSTGWATIATVDYRGDDEVFHPWLRHRFELATPTGANIQITGLRFKVPNANTAIDEIEVNTQGAVQPPHLTIAREGAQVVIAWTGNGSLQSSPDIKGTWTDVPSGATSPQRIDLPATGRSFYRVRP